VTPRVSARRLAEIAITVQFLALVRTLAEFYRLRAVRGATLSAEDVAPYVAGGLIAASGAWIGVLCFFVGRYRLATGAAGATVLALLVYKFGVMS
jgi:hypothetical protein